MFFQLYCFSVDTTEIMSLPSSVQPRACASRSASDTAGSVQMTPTMAPVSRSCRVSARVSTSAMPTTPCLAQKSDSVLVLR